MLFSGQSRRKGYLEDSSSSRLIVVHFWASKCPTNLPLTEISASPEFIETNETTLVEIIFTRIGFTLNDVPQIHHCGPTRASLSSSFRSGKSLKHANGNTAWLAMAAWTRSRLASRFGIWTQPKIIGPWWRGRIDRYNPSRICWSRKTLSSSTSE
jgi:hypothetical protein